MKKFLALFLTVTLTATLAVCGTLAYLQHEDSDVNVMTLGNVKIEQHEYQRVEENGTYKTGTIDNKTSYVLEAFEQNKPLLPIVGDPSEPGDSPAYAGWDATTVRMSQVKSYGGMQVFAGKNAQDKFVTVENTGKNNAYIRTLVAIEIGSTDGSLIGTSHHNTWAKNPLGTIEIDGNNYMVTEYTYKGGQLSDGSWRHENGILPAGDTSYPNLSQVYLKSVATNEDMVAIDGNGNGTLDILVLSQAIQVEGFTDAKTALDTGFGETTEENVAEWFGGISIPVSVGTAEDLTAALANGQSVILTADVDLDADDTIYVEAGKSVTLNLNGHKLSGTADGTGGNREMFLVKGNMEVTNGEIVMTATQNQAWNAMAAIFDVTAGGVLNMSGVKANVSGTDMTFVVHLNNWGEVTLNVDHCDFTANYVAVRAFNSGNDMNNVTIKNTDFHTGRAFWVHNYTSEGKDDSTLKLDIYGNGNTADHEKPVRFGFSNSVYYDINGNVIE